MGVIHGGNTISGGNVNSAIEQTTIAGGAAGAHTVNGIGATDTLVSVVRITSAGVYSVITSEFSVTAANTIDNTAGTATTGDVLRVEWLQA